MNDIVSRWRALPTPLVDGRVTHCELLLADGRIRFTEPKDVVAMRLLGSLRRRGRWLAATVGGAIATLALRGVPRGVAALATVVAGLGTLDGLGADLSRRRQPYEFASLDTVRREVDLRVPQGWTLTAPLHEVRAFLLVIDPLARRCHLGLVLGEQSRYVPWMGTGDLGSALALCWVFAHLSDRPALRVVGSLPLAPDWRENVEDVPPPNLTGPDDDLDD